MKKYFKTFIFTIIILTSSAGIFFNYNKIIKLLIPKFELYNVEQTIISNKNYELYEQVLLYKYLDKEDIVLQLGGNIGTSCILVDKLVKNKDKQICVEPNKDIIKTLEKNKNLNGSKFIIINSIISEGKCNFKKNELEGDDMKVGVTFTSNDSEIQHKSSEISCISYDEIEKIANTKINTLFLDCEGCACSFLDQYDDKLVNINKIIIENDMKDICNYEEKVIPKLKKHNFKLKEGKLHQIWIKNKN
jgi:FkbM family methyltransferase